MAQFQVPQFTEVEDKIFGPLTFKQFVYVLGGAASVFIIWVSLPKWLAIILAIPAGAFFGAMAFLKINDRPFIQVVSSAVSYFFGARLYTWKKTGGKKIEIAGPAAKTMPQGELPKVTEGRLKDLAWSLDIHKKLER